VSELLELTSKLIQFHSIKYPNRQIESIYLMGGGADETARERLMTANSIPVEIIGGSYFSGLAADIDPRVLVYSAGAVLGSGG
jgi:hypothetical protein